MNQKPKILNRAIVRSLDLSADDVLKLVDSGKFRLPTVIMSTDDAAEYIGMDKSDFLTLVRAKRIRRQAGHRHSYRFSIDVLDKFAKEGQAV